MSTQCRPEDLDRELAVFSVPSSIDPLPLLNVLLRPPASTELSCVQVALGNGVEDERANGGEDDVEKGSSEVACWEASTATDGPSPASAELLQLPTPMPVIANGHAGGDPAEAATTPMTYDSWI